MKGLQLLVISFFVAFSVTAQSDLIVQQDGSRLYLNHAVMAKENFYSIGRIYNISPREIAPYNNLTLESGLEIGQLLSIPLTTANFAQAGVAASDESFVPLYHVVSDKEGLFRIGQNFNKVPVNNIKVWNNLQSDAISSGQTLVIGYLRVKNDNSPLAANGIKRIGGAVTINPPTVVTNVPIQETRPQANTSTANTNTSTSTVATGSPSTDGSGFFKSVYQQQNRTTSIRSEFGSAAIFKSTSGWQDGKYYALMNNVTPGTIVRIMNPTNKKAVYAKVLGELPPGKENEGLMVRISNAAAAELKLADRDASFSAEIAYGR